MNQRETARFDLGQILRGRPLAHSRRSRWLLLPTRASPEPATTVLRACRLPPRLLDASWRLLPRHERDAQSTATVPRHASRPCPASTASVQCAPSWKLERQRRLATEASGPHAPAPLSWTLHTRRKASITHSQERKAASLEPRHRLGSRFPRCPGQPCRRPGQPTPNCASSFVLSLACELCVHELRLGNCIDQSNCASTAGLALEQWRQRTRQPAKTDSCGELPAMDTSIIVTVSDRGQR